MSYILDALRRADAERERGNVPGLHAQPTRRAPSGSVTSQSRAPWLRASIAVLLLGLLALIWRLQRQEASAPTGAIAAASSVATVVSAAGLSAPAAVERSLPVVPEVTVVAPARPRPQPLSSLVSTRKTVPTVVPPRSPPEINTIASAPGASSGTIVTAEELPEDIRRDLPKLAIGGSIYSESASSRFVIVNGQLLHEGDTVVPGLVLQQIKLKSAILTFRGYRYRIAL